MIYKSRTLKQLSESKDPEVASKAKETLREGCPEYAIFDIELKQIIIY